MLESSPPQFKQRSRMSTLISMRGPAICRHRHRQQERTRPGLFVKYGEAAWTSNPSATCSKLRCTNWPIPGRAGGHPETHSHTDTYSAPCDQEEFFFAPFETLDLIWFALEHQFPPAKSPRSWAWRRSDSRVFDDIAANSARRSFCASRLPFRSRRISFAS